MAIVCYICKKEIELTRFGTGFVGVCCKNVLYNYSDKPQFDMRQDEKKDIYMHSFHQERRSYQAKHS
jgi:hypothetical protein